MQLLLMYFRMYFHPAVAFKDAKDDVEVCKGELVFRSVCAGIILVVGVVVLVIAAVAA